MFYNRILKCFVIIDLKLRKVIPEDIGQMQMYVNYYDREIKLIFPTEEEFINVIENEKKNFELV